MKVLSTQPLSTERVHGPWPLIGKKLLKSVSCSMDAAVMPCGTGVQLVSIWHCMAAIVILLILRACLVARKRESLVAIRT